MLTLFKPWRSGLHLKTESETWDESFSKYQFNESQIRIIQNFNIRYECLDAQDDYRAALKKGGIDTIISNWEKDMLNDHDDPAVGEWDNENVFEEDGSNLNTIGKYEKSRQMQILQIKNVMMNAGWTKEIVGNIAQIVPEKPGITRSGTEWKAEVQKKNQEEIDW